MNSPTAALGASNLMKAFRSRWRTGPTSSSMSLAQGLEHSVTASSGMRVRPRTLNEGLNLAVSGPGPLQPGHRFITIDELRAAAQKAFKESGFATMEEFIEDERKKQEREFVNRTGRVDSYSAQVLGIPMTESIENPDSDYDPSSPEPRFLQMAKAERLRRRDLKCRDCGFTGLPAPVDGNCPECGGLMDAPGEQALQPSRTADEIRAAIRQQAQDQKVGLKADESVHSTVPGHEHDIHMHDLVSHYGFKANGDHYVQEGDHESKLYVNSNGTWVHKHHGVRHEGHGHRALASHLARHKNHRS